MTPIRPGPGLPVPLAPAAPATDARAAFFQAALARTQAPTALATAPLPAVAETSRPLPRTSAPGGPDMRPGSLLDIRV